MTPQADRSFRESIDSFRRMSLKESAEVKPLRLKIVTVGAKRHGARAWRNAWRSPITRWRAS